LLTLTFNGANMKKTILICGFLLITSSAFGRNKKLNDYINNEIVTMTMALNELNSEPMLMDSKWFLNTFRVHITGSVGIQIPFLAQFTLNPMVQFFFSRPSPQGLIPYRPSL